MVLVNSLIIVVKIVDAFIASSVKGRHRCRGFMPFLFILYFIWFALACKLFLLNINMLMVDYDVGVDVGARENVCGDGIEQLTAVYTTINCVLIHIGQLSGLRIILALRFMFVISFLLTEIIQVLIISNYSH